MNAAAVIFDLGGVVLQSPLDVIASYESESRIPEGTINRHVAGQGDDGAWGRHEKGLIDFATFCDLFESELAAKGVVVDAAELMARIAAFAVSRPAVLAEIARLRTAGYKVAALTNSWETMPIEGLEGSFDLVVESWREGVRKPDREIFATTLERLRVTPGQTLFIDDLGPNLKTARAMGMDTFKATDEESLVRFLRALGS